MKTFLPIVGRELRVASRRASTYWSRSRTVLGGTIPVALLLAGAIPGTPSRQLGALVFQALSLLAFLFALFGSVRLTADSLSGEKRDGTLGFLFLTDLRPYDVVFGKLAATALGAVYALLALLPVLSIPMLWGGVTLADLLRLALVLLNTLFFALSLALLVSAFSWQENTAVGVTVLLLAGVGVGLPMTALMTSALGTSGLASVLWLATPGYACLHVAERSYRPAPGEFWVSCALVHALGWSFLWICCRALPRVWQDRPAEKRRLRWREWCRRLLLGDAASRAAFRARLLELNPIYWFGSRERRVVWYPWLFLGSMMLLFGVCLGALGPNGLPFELQLAGVWGLNFFFKHWVTTQACFAFSTDRDKGALELLLSTSLGVKEMLRGHDLALLRQFLAPVLAVIVLEFAALAWAGPWPRHGGDETGAVILPLLGLLVFVVDLLSWRWLGYWMGAISRNASRALAATYFRVLVIPALLWVLGLLAVSLLDLPERGMDVAAMALYLAISFGADWIYARWARRRLLQDLRTAAAERGDREGVRPWSWSRLMRVTGGRARPRAGEASSSRRAATATELGQEHDPSEGRRRSTE